MAGFARGLCCQLRWCDLFLCDAAFQGRRIWGSCHGSQFDLDGTYIQGPAPRDLDTFAVQVVDAQTQDVIAETSEDGDTLRCYKNLFVAPYS